MPAMPACCSSLRPSLLPSSAFQSSFHSKAGESLTASLLPLCMQMTTTTATEGGRAQCNAPFHLSRSERGRRKHRRRDGDTKSIMMPLGDSIYDVRNIFPFLAPFPLNLEPMTHSPLSSVDFMYGSPLADM